MKRHFLQKGLNKDDWEHGLLTLLVLKKSVIIVKVTKLGYI